MSDQAMGIRLENAEAEVEHLKALCDSYEATVQRLEADTGEMVSHLASVVNELQEENELLKARAQALLDKMDLCEEALDGILRMAAVHGLKYSGPTYTEEKFELGAAVRGVPTVNKDCGS